MARLPGFRTGHVPASIIKQRFKEDLKSDVVEAVRNLTGGNGADLCVARAVASLPTLVELCGPLTATGGLMIFPKGSGWEAERRAAEPRA